MTQLFTILFVLAHFIPGLPKARDAKSLSRPELVRAYSKACTGFFNRPEFNGGELLEVIKTVLASVKSKQTDLIWLEGKGTANQVISFYEKICTSSPDLEALDSLSGEINEAINQYEDIVRSLPAVSAVRNLKLDQATEVVSSDEKALADLSVPKGRRRMISFEDLPPLVPKTLVAVEDSRFYDHHGIDEFGILRSLMKDMMKSGKRQGASTITQQLARNLYLDSSISMERKLREILIAEKIEQQVTEGRLTKNEILTAYLNLIYFGRNAYGIEKASSAYFGKRVSELSTVEIAFLIGIIHGPNVYHSRPDLIPGRVQFVLEQMVNRKLIPGSTHIPGLLQELKILPNVDPYNMGYFRDYAIQVTKGLRPAWLTAGVRIKTPIDSKLQKLATESLQAQLISFDRNVARRAFKGPLDNIQNLIQENLQKIEEKNAVEKNRAEMLKHSLSDDILELPTERPEPQIKPWLTPLTRVSNRFSVPVSNWKLAVLLDGKGRIGMTDGKEGYLSTQSISWASQAEMGDVFYVRAVNKNWEIVQVPELNGAVVVMDTNGRILAMVGGFSYAVNPFNRAVNAFRQPGSLMKPFTYLAALQQGFQPNKMLSDAPVSFRFGNQVWTPGNYDGKNAGTKPMAWAIANSQNIMTVRLSTETGLDPIRKLAKEFGLYYEANRDQSFVLGSQETTLLALTKTYAEFANGGRWVEPKSIDQIRNRDGKVSTLEYPPGPRLEGVDDISMYQLRSLMQGVIARGTASQLSRFSDVLAGKTGTSNDSKDVWFIGYTSNLVIGVFVGYDKPRSLGVHATGGGIALPIFERIFKGSLQLSYIPEPFPRPPEGIVFQHTHFLTGDILSTPTKDTLTLPYRKSALK